MSKCRASEPHRWYWYRFDVGSEESPIGRTRTAPAAGSGTRAVPLRLCVLPEIRGRLLHRVSPTFGDQEDLDLVLHLGDYIYEGKAKGGRVRKHNSGECMTRSEDYRNRYAQYKLDPDLQAAHAAFPWAVVPDDHEVDNDYANDKEVKLRASSDGVSGTRRAVAYQASLRTFAVPARVQAQRAQHATLSNPYLLVTWPRSILLDTRQYRTDQPVRPKMGRALRRCAGSARNHARARFRSRGSSGSSPLHHGQWMVLAQQVPIMQRKRFRVTAEIHYHMDKWDGYVAARERLFASIQQPSGRSGIVAVYRRRACRLGGNSQGRF